MENNKLIKAVHTKRYSVELLQTPNHMYVITRNTKQYNNLLTSEVIKDFNGAAFLFDLAISDFEGQ